VRGKETDARCDIWSLAVVMYEMITGTTPFAADTANDSIAAILTKKPASLGEDVPLELKRIIKKALQKQADERYQTVKDLLLDVKNLKRELELSEALERSYRPPRSTGSSNVRTGEIDENAATLIQPGLISTETSGASHQISGAEMLTSSIRQHKFGASAILAAAVIILAGFGYGLYSLIERPQIESPKTGGQITTRRLTGDGKTATAEISPDGKFLAYGTTEGGDSSLSIKQIQTNSTIQIVRPGDILGFYGIRFSPDGGFVYFNAVKDAEVPSIGEGVLSRFGSMVAGRKTNSGHLRR
jgi:serine/threonine protein kinase